MPLGMGENVGSAYVRIYADGSGLDDDIKREFDKATKDAHLESSGEKAGKDYTKGFSDELGKGPGWKKAIERMNLSIARGIKAKDYFNSPNWKKFVKTAEEEFGDVGFAAAKSMEQEFLRRGTTEGLLQRMETFYAEVNTLEAEAAQARQKNLDRIAEDARRQRKRDEAALVRDMEQTARDIDRILRQTTAAMVERGRANERFWRSIKDGLTGVSRDFDRFQKEMDDTGTHLDLFADRMGATFGRGSRNDFLNFMGSFVRMIPLAASAVTRFASNLSGLVDEMIKAGSLAGGGAKGAGAAFEVFATSMKGSAYAAAAIIPILMGLSSTISLIAGSVTALAGTIGTGLVGGIAVLGGALVPLTAAIGALVVAFISLSDAEKELLGQDLRPLTTAFSGLAEIAKQNIFTNLGDSLSRMAPFIQSLAPLMDGVTQAIRRQMDAWAGLVASGAFNSFITVLERDLPRQIDLLGELSRSITTSFTGIFRALSPVVSRFLEDLNDLVDGFSDWANSVRGQTALSSYFNEAYDAARALGGAVLGAIEVIGNLLRAGAGYGGNELFRDLTDQFAEWSDYLTDPKNQAAIEQWVSDGADFARSLGDIVVAVGELIAAFDTPMMRTGINLTLQTMAGSASMAATALDSLLDPSKLPTMFAANLGLIDDKAAGASASIGQVTVDAGGFADAVAKAEEPTTRLGQKVQTVGEQMEGAAERAEKFSNTIDTLVNPALDAEEALDELVLTTRGLSNELQRGAGFKGFSRQAIENREATRDWGREMHNTMEAMIAANEPARKVANTAIRQARAFIDEGVAAGKSRKELMDRLRAMRLTPKQIRTSILTPGMRQALRDARQLTEQLREKLPKNVFTRIKALGIPKTIEDAKKLARQLDLSTKDRKTLITVVKERAQADIKETGDRADQIIEHKTRTMKVQADTTAAINKMNEVSRKGNELDAETFTPTVDVNDAMALAALTGVTSELNNIDGRVVTFTIQGRRAGAGAASGGIIPSPTNLLVGEAGPEAIVPLQRPLGQVDPAVRGLSAIAQGLARPGVSPNGGRTLNVGPITVTTPTRDPYAVAIETVNRLAIVGGF